MSAMVMMAVRMARGFHRGHRRKYTGEPYMVHLVEVAGLVAAAGLPDVAIAAALLHDSIEDTTATYADIESALGKTVADLVLECTDVDEIDKSLKKFNRATRKRLMREKLAEASYLAKSIKLADMISNTKDVAAHDLAFSKVYLPEMRLLIWALLGGHPSLMETAENTLIRAEATLAAGSQLDF